MTRQVLILGAGNIGPTIAEMLLATGRYQVTVADQNGAALDRLPPSDLLRTRTLDCTAPHVLTGALQGFQAVVSALPFQLNRTVAAAALEAGVSYFDLTEDVATTQAIRDLAIAARPGQVFMPQCGLAPGFIGIVAFHLCKWFDTLEKVEMRVGALPRYASNQIFYNLTWSTEGLINEYTQPCEAIHNGRRVQLLPLEGVEHLLLDGDRYEAFNTSGGLGTLCETLAGRVSELNYKTIRYVGHRELMTFLTEGLQFVEPPGQPSGEPAAGTGQAIEALGVQRRREILRGLLERSIPTTFQDVVVIFCTVTGLKDGRLVQISDARKVYGRGLERHGGPRSAIQTTTAAGLCAVLDLHLAGRLRVKQGFVRQEDVDFPDFMSTEFGRHYADGSLA